jgi:tripartite-type tricarboxylate transporter receptor subunit TctC
VQIIVPFAAGGAVDVIARSLGDILARTWGQQPVIDNRPGAGGVVASQVLVRAAPDGHMIMVVANGHPLNQFFYPSLPYDTYRDFTPITQIASSPLVISVAKNQTAATLAALVETGQGKAGGVNYGVSGFGTSAHLAGVLISTVLKRDMTPIPHRSGTQALQSVIAGDLPISINPLLEALPQVRAGNVRAIAITTAVRSPLLPDIATAAEQGLAGFDTGVWWGIVAPAGLPAPILEKLSRDIAAAIASPELRQRLDLLGATAVASSPQDFSAFIRAEAEKWGPVIRAANVKLE